MYIGGYATGLFGHDIGKVDRPQVPEAAGVIVGAVYLVCMFLFIPFPFLDVWFGNQERDAFPHAKYAEFLCALLSICCMIFLGNISPPFLSLSLSLSMKNMTSATLVLSPSYDDLF